MESWNNNNVSVTQTLTSIPNGLYKLTVDMISGNDTKTAYVYAMGEEEVNGDIVSAKSSAGDYTTMSNEVAGNTLTADNINVTGNELIVGFKDPSGWIVADNFKLYYYGPTVAGDAVALPANGAMTANTWYYYDLPSTDDYEFTSTEGVTLSYTANGNQLLSEVTTTDEALTASVANTITSLPAGRLYFKASAATTLTVSYKYSIGEATANISYVQAGNTVTVTFPTSTNDPSASLTQDYSSVTFGGNAVTCTATANGFTFTVPTVTAATDYTLSIPAGAIKYNAENQNAAQDITLHTPAIFDGTYYLYNSYTGLFLGRGNIHGTAAVVDKYGIPCNLVTGSDGISTVQFVDNNLYLYATYWLYADGGTGDRFSILAQTVGEYTGYALYNQNLTENNRMYVYLKRNADDYRVAGNAIIGDNCTNAEQTVWTFKTVAEHNAIVNAYPIENIQHVITASGINTSTSDFTTYMAANYVETDMTAKIGTATFGSDAGSWTWTAVKTQDDWPKYTDGIARLYQATGSYTQTIAAANLPAGIYKVIMGGFDRRATEAIDRTLAAPYGSVSSSYLKANDEQVRIMSWVEANNSYGSETTTWALQAACVNGGKAVNKLYIYLDGSTDLTLTVAKPNYCADSYLVFSNFTLTRYEAKATAAEKTALADAITAAEGHTLGFEDTEYAPYNNITALEALAAAKAIEPETASGVSVVEATTTLTNAHWTANTANYTEAVYNGNFATGQGSVAADIQQYGWTRTAAWGQFVNNADANSTSNGTAYYNQYGSMQYGNAGAYTMPLKASTVYTLKFKYAAQDSNVPTPTVSVLNGDDGMAAMTFASNANIYTASGAFAAIEMVFVTGAAGNYILTIAGNHNLVITDVSIKKAESQILEFADGSVPTYAPGTYPTVKISRSLTAGRWATAVYPFAVSRVDGLTIANLSSYSDGALGFSTEAAASTANVPFLMKSTSDKSEISLSDVAVAAAAVTDATASEASLKGAYTETTVGAGEGVYNYVLSNNTIYKVGENAATINPYRAYIQLTQPTKARALTFLIDGEDTQAIEGISVAERASGVLYNLQGQRVEKAGKGLFIQNGKKMVRR